MIPRIIHYCWFSGNKKPDYVLKCLESWHIHLPDFEIKEWNESNFPLTHPFLKNAMHFKLWAFVADFARVVVLKKEGGIYLDTDILFIRSLPEHFLTYDAFAGAEDEKHISAGIIGAKKESVFIDKLFNYYNSLGSVTNYNEYIIPRVITHRIFALKAPITDNCQFDDLTVFMPDYFYPLPGHLKNEDWTPFVTPNTICVHLWGGSWLEKQSFNVFEKIRNRCIREYAQWKTQFNENTHR